MGIQTIKAQVHLVPTDKLSTIGINKATGHMYSFNPVVSHEGQHLYITTDEEIKEGDYFIIIPEIGYTKALRKCKEVTSKYVVAQANYGIFKENCKKIVATTNPELEIMMDNPAAWEAGIKTIHLPKIDTPFIELFIKAYNEGNPIKEVLLEANIYNYPSSKETVLKLNQDGSVIIYPIKEIMYSKEQVIRMLMGFKSVEPDYLKRAKEIENYINDYYS